MFEDKERKICIICSKGTLDMAYPGLVLANAALIRQLVLLTDQEHLTPDVRRVI